MRRTTIAAVVAAVALSLSACGASSTGADPDALPQAETSSSAAAPAAPAEPEPAAPAEEPAPAASTCDAAREAILTGTKGEITKALKALQADKTADATAREYARYYLGRDKAQPDMQEMDIGIIQMSCTV